jgi:hypothetical protein
MTIETVQADRERIRAITSLPEAASQLEAALTMALTGASITEARAALSLRTNPRSTYDARRAAIATRSPDVNLSDEATVPSSIYRRRAEQNRRPRR